MTRSTPSSASPRTTSGPLFLRVVISGITVPEGGDVLEMSRSIGGADGDHLALPGWAACPVVQDTKTQLAGSLYRATSTTLHIIDV